MPDRGARSDEAIRSFQEQADRATQLRETISDLRGHARNHDGSVTVTVAPSGAVLGLQLGPAAMRRSHTQLRQEILTTIRQATQQAADALRATVTPVLGERAGQFDEALSAHAAVPPLGPTTPPRSAPCRFRTTRTPSPRRHHRSRCRQHRSGHPDHRHRGRNPTPRRPWTTTASAARS